MLISGICFLPVLLNTIWHCSWIYPWMTMSVLRDVHHAKFKPLILLPEEETTLAGMLSYHVRRDDKAFGAN